MQLDEFARRFHEIRNQGFIKSLRRGPTGVGHTLESLLGLGENNIALPDLHDVELKAHRAGGNSLITLFTFNRKAWITPPLTAIREHGSNDRSGRRGLYYTMSVTPNSAGLFLNVTNETIDVRHVSGKVIAEWQLQTLVQRFMEKMPALLFVSASVDVRDDVEYFHYKRAQLMRGTTPELLVDHFRSETVVVDLRLHDQGTSARNHGTGFRVLENNLPSLFTRIEDL